MRKEKEAQETTRSLQRYALTGAALGLYFGLFFRPVRQPSWLIVVGLSLLAALVTVGVRLWKEKRPSFPAILKALTLTWARFAVLLAVLEGRHLAYDLGGRIGATIMTTLLGGLGGALWAYRPEGWPAWPSEGEKKK